MSASALSSRAIIGEFFDKLSATNNSWSEQISVLFNSNQESETYPWLGTAPVMRELKGGRQAKGFRSNQLTILNKEYEATLEVLVSELRRDKTQQILTRVREMAIRANKHWDNLLSTLINNGAANLCYDGQYFFDTDHSEGSSGSQSNSITVDISALGVSNHGSVAAAAAEEMQQTILLSIQQILSLKDDQGEPMNDDANQFLVMVPSNYWSVGSAAVGVPTFGGGATNVLGNLDGFNISLVSNPRLTAADSIYTFRTDGEVKPLIRQEEVPLEMSAVAEGSELEFKERKHHYGVFASRNAGYGYWQHACKAQLI